VDGDATLSESVGEMKTCLSLCILSVLGVAVVIVSRGKFTTEAQSSQRSHRGLTLIRQLLSGLHLLHNCVGDPGLPKRNLGLQLAHTVSVCSAARVQLRHFN